MPNCPIHRDTKLLCPRCIRSKRTSYDKSVLSAAGKKGGAAKVPKGPHKKAEP